jgi:hypothetical protein
VGKKVTTVSGVAGVGSLLAGIGAPRMIEGLPPWVGIACFVAGAALILGAFLSYLLSAKRDEEPASETALTTHGPHSPAIGTVHGNVHIGPPNPAERQEPRSPYGSGISPDVVDKIARAIRQGVHGSEPVPRPWHQRPPAPPPATDFSLAGVLSRLYKIHRRPTDEAALPAFWRRIDLAITDAIAEHKLTVSGRVGNYARRRLERVELEFATVDHRRGELTLYGDDPQVFSDLKFNKREIDTVWPKPIRTTNDGRP